MFDFFRKHTKFLMVILFLLVIPSFVLFGLEQYSDGSRTRGEEVAVVDGKTISRPEWDARHRVETDRMREQQRNIDPALLDSEEARYATLERMVRERVLLAAAAKANMTVSDDRLARMFAEDPGIASFRDAEGKFDRQRFILTTGTTPEQYEAGIRSQLSMQQLVAGVSGTPLSAKTQADLTLNAIYDGREIQVARFAPQDFSAKVSLTDDDLQSHFKSHASRYQAQEAASIQYLLLDMDSVKKNVSVSDAELQSYYEQNQGRFGSGEERQASHILITAAKDAPQAERDKARARAQELLAQVRKTPATFAELARKNSQDPGSAERGGQLDMAPRGAMVKPFEDAMFALKKGEISDVVESDFGYHIIRLDDIKAAVVPPLAQVRAQVENEVRTQKAAQDFAKAAETLTELAYQNPESLQPAADALKLQIQTASGVARTAAAGAQGPLGNRNFVAAVYAPEVLDRKQNTEAIDLGSNQVAVARVTQYTQARAQTFDEVKEQVGRDLTAERAAALAKEEGRARLAAWEKDTASAKLGNVLKASRVDPQGQPLPVIEAALRTDAGKLPAWTGVDLGAEGFAVVRVLKDLPRQPSDAALQTQERAQMGQALAAAEAEAYYKLLSDRLKARILVNKPKTAAVTG
ncbi:SurA N-terminal domain-containing protein [Xenophilus arseniciresistens]|uniref:Periplasmic chaperone PpiD n=1 Tax=Xenophilus arseniciresistens TaxID=1283306 RepID=A0AAE3SZ62_9BURK|nr:SurA N-terminal domain-containing protein [Xenophilus arseniciresistens]MDA7416225.1 SurA N-terminal domain-containing protein [Xenophilus arseniciresistens]